MSSSSADEAEQALKQLKNVTYGQKYAFICYLLKRRKTTIQVIHLNQKELAECWRMSEVTLERWRSDRIGPVFLKIMGRVLYRLIDMDTFEVASLKGSFVEQRNQVAPMASTNSELMKAPAKKSIEMQKPAEVLVRGGLV